MANLAYPEFFEQVTGSRPYDYQIRLAESDCESRLISVPTGLGKTAAVVLAWLYNRVLKQDPNWPRRLVYCLPMRTLVEQTRDCCQAWLAKMGDLEWKPGEIAKGAHKGKVGLHILMGGEETVDWDLYPEENAILIGTQDMLLSRALNRGYGMSRYRWPMHFGVLNNDCLWILDETQLMGPGLWTSGQLDWMRQHRFGVLKSCVTWWMSATNSPVFLDTPDRRKDSATILPVLEVGGDQRARARLNPKRPLKFWQGSMPQAKDKPKKKSPVAKAGFSELLAVAIREEHTKGTLSLIVCNSVKAAQELYRALSADDAILLTSRFRREDRDDHTKRLLAFEEQRKEAAKSKDDTLPETTGLICISTQVIEAGVDISARKLWMEAAPWPSALQRLGRLNRDGVADGKAQAFVFTWPDEGKKGKTQRIGPYESKDIEASVKLLTKLTAIYQEKPGSGAAEAMALLRKGNEQAVDAALKPKEEPFPRAIDVHGLFSTEPDLFGGFTDVSPWVRGEDMNADVTIFWREFDAKKGPGKTETLSGPPFDPSEGCAVAIHRFRDFLGDKGRALGWDERREQWQSLRSDDICPGMVVMLPLIAGGYSEQLGWTGNAADVLTEVPQPGRFSDTFEDDSNSESAGWVSLAVHLADAKSAALNLADQLQLDDGHRTALVTAAELHDIGKAHRIWQNALPHSDDTRRQLWAKAPRVFVLHGSRAPECRESTQQLLGDAKLNPVFYRTEMKNDVPRLLWKVSDKIRDTRKQPLRSLIEDQEPGLEAWMRRFLPRPSWDKPCIRHEAASALAAWHQYFSEGAEWPGLTLYLIACHHGKVRTVLYARGEDGNDVCGVPKQTGPLPWSDGMTMDFSSAAVGTMGVFSEDGLTFTSSSPSWIAMVADLLGGWEARPADCPPPLALRMTDDIRHMGPFALAYLEALICVTDIHASKHPSDLRHA